MSRGIKILLIILGIIILFGLIIFSSIKGTYNSLVMLDEGVKASWAQVENQLQRRFDLIPNYVETVKGYAKHEKELFVKVTEARSKVGGAANIPDKIKANN
ncbi:MAG: LemA family protein, partial [Thermodesulfobacteriota bacterium]